VSERFEVIIVGDHPHSGCRGWVEINNGKVQAVSIFNGPASVKVYLSNCQHGVEACFAEARHIRAWADNQDYVDAERYTIEASKKKRAGHKGGTT
jgi:hypothetical protein